MKWFANLNSSLEALPTIEDFKNYKIVDQLIATDKTIETFSENNINAYFMGEIYNSDAFSEIEHKNKAELILKLYKKLGTNAFKKLDGEFTFIIKEAEQTIIFRDRHGAGSQVYYTGFFVASHPKLLGFSKQIQMQPNFDQIALFLKIGYIPSPHTALKGISKIPAGNVLTIDDKGNNSLTDLFPFIDFGSTNKKNRIDEKEATVEYERLHKKALKERVKGQDSVQLLLSGGYDSGGNIGGLRDIYQGKAYSYSIGFKNNPWSELPLAKILSETYETEHSEYEIDGTEIEFLPEIVNQFGDPFNESGMMVNYAAMKLVNSKQQKGIILGGDGNDQHFGTAGRELAMHYQYKSNGLMLAQKMLSSISDLPNFNKDNLFFKARFHNEKIVNILHSDNFGFRDQQISKLLNVAYDKTTPEYIKRLPKSFSSFDDLYNIHNYFGDIKQVINEVILFKASKLGDFYNNQITFPYMSIELYDFLKTLPREVKLKGDIKACSKGQGKSKFLHKNYLSPKLPKEITERKKQGGFAPLPIFFKDTKQFNKISEIILNSDFAKKYLNIKYLEYILDLYRSEKDKVGYWFWYKQVNAFRVFNILTLVVWWEVTIKNNPAKTLSEL